MVAMGNVWDRTAEFLSENIASILPIALVAFFIPTSIAGSFEPARATGGDGLKLGLGAMQLVFAILSLWGSLAITAMALDTGKASAAAGVALRRLPVALLVFVVMFVGMLVLAAPIGLMWAPVVDLETPALRYGDLDPSAVLGIAIYGFVLTILLFWLAARLIVTTGAIMAEDLVLGAIPRSWRLTRGHALRIVGVLILYMVVAWVAFLAATAVFGTIFQLVAGSEEEGVSLAGVLTSIVAAAVQAGFSVLGAAFTAKLYLALAAETSLRDASAAA